VATIKTGKPERGNIIDLTEYKVEKETQSEAHKRKVIHETMEEMGRDLMKLLRSYGYEIVHLDTLFHCVLGIKALIMKADGLEDESIDWVNFNLEQARWDHLFTQVSKELSFLPDRDKLPVMDVEDFTDDED
jgi:hypothetical protein